jgi:hypothetical protein
LTFRPSERTHRILSNEAFNQGRGANDWSLFGPILEATGTLALTANTAVVTPTFIPQHTTMSNVGIVVTTAGSAGQVARVAMYEWNPVTKALGNLVADFGTVLVDATGVRSAAANGLTVRSGWYAFVFVSNGTPTLRTFLAAQNEQSEAFTVSTAGALEATIHYTAATFLATGSAALATGASATLTRVTSGSEGRPNHFVVGQWVPSRIAV